MQYVPHPTYSSKKILCCTVEFTWCIVIGASLSEPHVDGTFHARIVYIYMYGKTVTRGAAHTQYTVSIPKLYSAQCGPHVVMFASSTAQLRATYIATCSSIVQATYAL